MLLARWIRLRRCLYRLQDAVGVIISKIGGKPVVSRIIRPSRAEIFPTNRCQLNCIGCRYYDEQGPKMFSSAGDWKRQELSLETFKEAVIGLYAAGFRQVVVGGGGDPLMHPSIYEMLSFCSRFHVTTLVSNLLLVQEPEKLVATGISKVILNFSSATPHDYVVFHPNQPEKRFYEILRTVDELKKKVDVHFSFILCRENAETIPGMIDVAGSSTGHAFFKIMRDSPKHGMTMSQRQQLKEKLPEYIELADRKLTVHNLRKLDPFVDAPDGYGTDLRPSACYSGYFTTAILANGDVTICCMPSADQEPIGNIHTQDFLTLWRSKSYAAARERFMHPPFPSFCKNCYFAEKNRECTAVLRGRHS